MNKRELIADLEEILKDQISRAEQIRSLPADRLLHRPAPEQWNVVEVFEHLCLSSGVYLRGLERAFRRPGGHDGTKGTFSPGLLGDYFTRSMRPKPNGAIGWKMRTMRVFDPTRQQGASTASIDKFNGLCRSFLALLTEAPNKDLDRLRVTSSLGPVIRFKAGDAFRFPIAHQQRHFLQIERLLGHQLRSS